MSSISVPEAFVATTGNGTTNGYVTVPNNNIYYPGATGAICFADGTHGQNVMFTDRSGSTLIGLLFLPASGSIPPGTTRSDCSAYLTGSLLEMPAQIVAVADARVDQLLAGTNVTLDPVEGTGIVEVSASGAGMGDLVAANNLSDLVSVPTARTNLGLGTLATQSGTFSGTSSGTNTGDQTITLTGDTTGTGTGSFATVLSATIPGISGGRTTTGGTGSGEGWAFSTTSNGTKGSFTFGGSTGLVYDEQNKRLGVGTTAATGATLDVAGSVNFGTHVTGVATQFVNTDTTAGTAQLTMYPASGTNSKMSVYISPRGAPADVAGDLEIYSTDIIADAVNYQLLGLFSSFSSQMVIASLKGGSKTLLPLQITTNVSSSTTGIVVKADLGTSVTINEALTTSATSGFLYIPTCPGTPTGVPTSYTGTAAIIFDTTNNRLVARGSSWININVYRPIQGTALTDSSQTIQPGTDGASEYVQSVALTASRNKTLGITSVITGTLVRITREDTANFTMVILNGGTNAGTLFTFLAAPSQFQGATFYYNGTDWVFVGFEYLKVT